MLVLVSVRDASGLPQQTLNLLVIAISLMITFNARNSQVLELHVLPSYDFPITFSRYSLSTHTVSVLLALKVNIMT